MNLYLYIDHRSVRCYNPPVGGSISFIGLGLILASAILRTSKSRYKVYVISKLNYVMVLTFKSFGSAVGYLQTRYSDELPNF